MILLLILIQIDVTSLLEEYPVQRESLDMKFTDDLLILLTLRLKNMRMENVAPYFGMSTDDIRKIQLDEETKNGRIVSMLSQWREKAGKVATNYSVIEILCQNGHPNIASEIINNLKEKRLVDIVPFKPWEETNDQRKEIVQNCLTERNNKVRKKYAITFTDIQESFCQRNVDHKIVIDYFKLYPGTETLLFEDEISNINSIKDVFSVIRKQSDWLNYHSLDIITSKFGSEDDKKRMTHYIQKVLWPYLQLSLYKIPPESVECYQEYPDSYHFILPVNKDNDKTGISSKMIQSLLAKKFRVSEKAILIKFKPGSIIVHFIIDKRLFATNDQRLYGFVNTKEPDVYYLNNDLIKDM